MLSNRAFAYIRLEEYGSAIADASAAVAADPKLPKVGETQLHSFSPEPLFELQSLWHSLH